LAVQVFQLSTRRAFNEIRPQLTYSEFYPDWQPRRSVHAAVWPQITREPTMQWKSNTTLHGQYNISTCCLS